MKPNSFWSRPLSLKGWIALVPILIFCGGMAWQQVIEASTRLGRQPPPLVVFSVSGASDQNGLETSAPLPAPARIAVYPDFGKQSALLLGAGELITHHKSVFVEIARAIDGQTPILALVSDEQQIEACEEALREAGVVNRGVHFVGYPLDSMWVRDYGPLFLKGADGAIEIVDTTYSSGADEDRWRDDECPILLSQALQVPLRTVPLRIQGGNILSDGAGLLLSSNCIIAQNATRGYNVRSVGQEFEKSLGATRWNYFEPASGEKTHHIDMFVTLLSPSLAVVAQADPALDPENAALLDETAATLSRLPAQGARMEVHRIPLPPRTDDEFRSYSNIAIVNDVVLVPTFSDVDPALEAQALAVYRKLMPKKKVVGIRADSMLRSGGFLRCISLGIPSGIRWRRLFDWDPQS